VTGLGWVGGCGTPPKRSSMRHEFAMRCSVRTWETRSVGWSDVDLENLRQTLPNERDAVVSAARRVPCWQNQTKIQHGPLFMV
jgi:integrase